MTGKFRQPERRSYQPLDVALTHQKIFDLDHSMAAHADWTAAGHRGRFLGSVKAPQVRSVPLLYYFIFFPVALAILLETLVSSCPGSHLALSVDS